eukprot:GHVT01088609.1.p1 GENE.GHVT01088609.1~~GHVT01088609.1.p1  ORF type:complete len:135 (-),score=15.42 GHVT01088609.1:754-1158(-)
MAALRKRRIVRQSACGTRTSARTYWGPLEISKVKNCLGVLGGGTRGTQDASGRREGKRATHRAATARAGPSSAVNARVVFTFRFPSAVLFLVDWQIAPLMLASAKLGGRHSNKSNRRGTHFASRRLPIGGGLHV